MDTWHTVTKCDQINLPNTIDTISAVIQYARTKLRFIYQSPHETKRQMYKLQHWTITDNTDVSKFTDTKPSFKVENRS